MKNLVPPGRIRKFVGPFENDPQLFLTMGKDYLELMRSRHMIAPTDSLLDVGCGCGLMALALSDCLTTGSYEGFDPNAKLIRWCQRHITTRFPAFQFRQMNVEHYCDETAEVRSAEFVFPYEDATFDMVIVKSIFTHMFPDGIQQYMSQISRVLKPGGRCMVTWYVLDQESLAGMQSGRSRWDFANDRDHYRIIAEDDPLRLIAHEETWLRELFDKTGFAIQGEIHRGGWRDNSVQSLGQDVVFGVRNTKETRVDAETHANGPRGGRLNLGLDPV